MKCDIIIPNYNGEALLHSSLPELVNTLRSLRNTHIVVVDNASTDSSVQFVTDTYAGNERVSLIQLDRNTGFTGACNAGAFHSNAEILIFLNNDCTLPHTVLDTMYRTMQKTDMAVQPVILRQNKEIENCGFLLDKRLAKATPIIEPESLEKFKEFARWDDSIDIFFGITAACFGIRRQAFLNVGGFDVQFHSYLEDIDLSIRLAKHHYPYTVLTDCFVVHRHRSTSSVMGVYKEKRDLINWLHIIRKHYTVSYTVRNLYHIGLERLRNLSGLIKAVVNSRQK